MDGKMMAFCGLLCAECPLFIGTQTDNQELLKETAEKWFGPNHQVKIEELKCDGCTAGKRLPKYCAECAPRNCALERKLENCGWCDEYPCAKLTGLWKMFKLTEPKGRLDEVKRGVR